MTSLVDLRYAARGLASSPTSSNSAPARSVSAWRSAPPPPRSSVSPCGRSEAREHGGGVRRAAAVRRAPIRYDGGAQLKPLVSVSAGAGGPAKDQ
jgi:hypothetical protein